MGTTMRTAYSTKVIPKKSADTMLTRLLTTSGNDVVSAINPLAITKASTIRSSNFNARTIASTIGVRISAAPSFANKADTAAPNRME
ncbi:hypothetical protein D3C76_1350630 [compost metagenome]